MDDMVGFSWAAPQSSSSTTPPSLSLSFLPQHNTGATSEGDSEGQIKANKILNFTEIDLNGRRLLLCELNGCKCSAWKRVRKTSGEGLDEKTSSYFEVINRIYLNRPHFCS